jgi:uncharacterized protein YjbI with pentapeptide repeats
MANRAQVRRLKQGVKAWNAWRVGREVQPNLIGAKFSNLDLRKVNFHNTKLSHAILKGSNLAGAKLSFARLDGANLDGVDLSGADLNFAELQGASLIEANMQNANLGHAICSEANFTHGNFFKCHLNHVNFNGANLTAADLAWANFQDAYLGEANFTRSTWFRSLISDSDLSNAIGLETCVHEGPSSIDFQTLHRSGMLPLTFLRGIGLPDAFIEYLPSIIGSAIQHYSSFISYSSKDQSFSNRLYVDLQGVGVRCWFAPHDMPIGGKIFDEIDAAIRLRDKVMLILSEHSIASDWVEDEVTKAFEEERKRGQTVLFPIRLDDAVMDTNEAWAAKLRARHIGDFRRWKEHDEYQKSFARVLRDLTVKKGG